MRIVTNLEAALSVSRLNAKLDLWAGANRDELERAMKGHMLAQGELMGKYGR
jgi:hypothetical protein